jgi:hypothetical protein
MGFPAPVTPLMKSRGLEPTFKSRQSHEYFCATQSYQGLLSGNTKGSTPELEPFLLSGDDKVLAGRFRRSDCAEAWLLPSDTPNIHLWVKAGIAEWHQLDSKRFLARRTGQRCLLG